MENNNTKRGKFIVFYGINNLGKSTQAKKLVQTLKEQGEKAEYLKYPIYELEPSGNLINNYLRGGNQYSLSPREAQIIYVLNRGQYEKELKKKLDSGINIISEDYTGTGLAWGITAGVDELFLKYINKHLLKEDLAFLFDGERFIEAEEKDHKHESDQEIMDRARITHLKLGQELGWIKINANRPIEVIHQEIYSKIKHFNRNGSFTFNNYQKESRQTALYPDLGNNFIYPTLGLTGEAGEVSEKVKKIIRDKNGLMDQETEEIIKKELGDVLWYLSQLATEMNLSLEDVAQENLHKLSQRKENNTLHGEGDNR